MINATVAKGMNLRGGTSWRPTRLTRVKLHAHEKAQECHKTPDGRLKTLFKFPRFITFPGAHLRPAYLVARGLVLSSLVAGAARA